MAAQKVSLFEMAEAIANSDAVSKEVRRHAWEIADLLRSNRPWRKITKGNRAWVSEKFSKLPVDR